jgi:hypothetical protein
MDNLPENKIRLTDLKHRQMYKIDGRNIRCGIWDAENQHFVGLAYSYTKQILDTELEWETDPRYGTAYATTEINVNIPETVTLQPYFPDEKGNLCEVNTELFNIIQPQHEICLEEYKANKEY